MKPSAPLWVLLLLLLASGCGRQRAPSIEAIRARAEEGEAVAQYNLGARYALGEGVVVDKVVAVEWCRKAADQRHTQVSSLLTQRQHLLFVRLRFWGLIQQVGNVSPSAHLQALGDPLQTHGRFLAKAARQHHLRPVPLGPRPQLILIPPQPLHFCLHHLLGFLQPRLLTLCAVVAGTNPLGFVFVDQNGFEKHAPNSFGAIVTSFNDYKG